MHLSLEVPLGGITAGSELRPRGLHAAAPLSKKSPCGARPCTVDPGCRVSRSQGEATPPATRLMVTDSFGRARGREEIE